MEKEQKKYFIAIVALFVAAFFWGSAFCVIKGTLDALTPFYLLAVRFLLAGVILLLLFATRLQFMTKRLFKRGLLLGIFLFFEFAFFTVGIKYTTASKSSFLLASYIIIIPLIYWLVAKTRPTKYAFGASATCMMGLCFIILDDLSALNKGDFYSIICAVFYAIHIVYTSKFVRDDDGILLNMMQILTGGICSLIVALIAEPFPSAVPVSAWGGITYLAIGCTIAPYVCSMFGQKYTKTSTAAVILSFESVFGCLLSALLLGERVSYRFIIGGALVVASFFVSERES